MKYRKLVVSTGNEHKIEEIRDILKGLPIEVLSKKDVGLGNLDIVEDGNSLEENSIKKAKGLADKLDYMVLADDSGLFVDALNGEPGVYSFRYGGEEGNYKKNNDKLLEELKDVPLEERKAKFITVMALITEDKEILVVKGECKGSIGIEPKGSNGFGYDPLFVPDGYTKTFAELGDNIKNKISHRAKALENLREKILELLED
ncbi:MAG: RdgB/HAM1 family non-canonical purine NTP pyrophosphatase [Tissierellia bacterium]|nr:RdgB/HAM1 family non-canonical purine NTP pyrophosphatase [Tissierellia bacterium]